MQNRFVSGENRLPGSTRVSRVGDRVFAIANFSAKIDQERFSETLQHAKLRIGERRNAQQAMIVQLLADERRRSSYFETYNRKAQQKDAAAASSRY